MNWYDTFNAVEAALWAVVALVILTRLTPARGQQRWAVVLGSVAFLAFGLTDLLEIGSHGLLPLWLWGSKIACGCAILSARYTWVGWTKFRWRDREVLFGVACLISVVALIVVQRMGDGFIRPEPSQRNPASTEAGRRLNHRGTGERRERQGLSSQVAKIPSIWIEGTSTGAR